MSVARYPFRPEGDDWLSFSLTTSLNIEKKGFYYSNIPSYLADVITEKAVKQNLGDYLRQRLFEPFGITDPFYSTCPRGHFYGASGMELTVDELAQLGQLYLQNGCWNGRQILSEAWIKEAASSLRPEKGAMDIISGCALRTDTESAGKGDSAVTSFPRKNW